MHFAPRLLTLLAVATAAVLAPAQRTPDEALRALAEGNRRFATDRSVVQPLGEGVRRTLARGHSPFAVVLCCADSRVPPEHVFNAGLGELFVVRVAGHCADAETVASVEYAVEHLGASVCVVLGHEQCGAVAAAIAQVEAPAQASPHSPALRGLLEQIEPAVRKAKGRDLGGAALRAAGEEEHAHATVHDCLRRSELLRRYAALGKFRMVAARYHLQSGEVEWLPPRPLPDDAPAAAAHAPAAPAGTPPHVALRMLQSGHRRFLGDGKPSADLTAARREALTHGQQPLAIVLTCADSRVAPEHVFDAGLGELFVIRIAGNTINDDALASIEYAAGHLGASLLVVMGHSACGAVQAAAKDPAGHELTPNLRALLLRLEPSVAAARSASKGRDLVDLAVRANVARALQEARSRSAALRALEHDGRFALLGCVYDLASGDLEWLKDAGPVAAGEPPAAPGHGEHAANGEHGAERGHAAVAEHGDLPVIDWAGGHAAPAGETAPHGTAAKHGAGDAHGGSHGAHGDGPNTHDAEHGASTAPAPAHPHGHGGGPGDGAHPHGAQAAGHAAGHADARGTPPAAVAAPAPWRDPIVLVGVSGVLSLLAAAVLAMKRR